MTRHRRFSLDHVTLGGVPVGGATIDAWTDGLGAEQWSARVLMPVARAAGSGLLVGTTRDGHRLRGSVLIGEVWPGPGSRREVLVELHGSGPLEEAGDQPDADEASR